ncbi:aminodeoxychorismate synthase component I [Persicirhabdus sediminis]|uniref:Aminodeoxychorismate synthase component I n=1 Tax=Persicirhabdus sediminis TaxID=454144 RepID=A0A8J7SI86_9BACT|nr:aminodeoxychorismate synthase component I [Persicirhabdus sediminis]MBK1790271.1 aminodeoxychorismate synthase component I [Persicirhabdus sediminis]
MISTFPLVAPELVQLEFSPAEVVAGLQHLDGVVFYDSAGNFPADNDGRYSIIAAQPVSILSGCLYDADDFSQLQEVMELTELAFANLQLGPATFPFPLGGLFGSVDYSGEYCFGLYNQVLAYDHLADQWWQIGQLASEMLTPASDSNGFEMGEFQPQMQRADYIAKVDRIKEYIAAGDIYQVNLAQKFSAHVSGGSLLPLYQSLRESSPAPYALWMQLAGREVLSSSPELFLKMHGRRIETRPIKGTRPRCDDAEQDAAMARELAECEKERAELVMITDLERNDLGQVCEFGSVQVDRMLYVERLEQVYHLVSSVSGELREGISHLEALRACYPGGSITGAPKKRAMEIIDELEPVARGLYTGTVGFLGANGVSQFNIVIRSLVREHGEIHYHVGAGIVADSISVNEFEETLHKARGMRMAVESWQNKPSQ